MTTTIEKFYTAFQQLDAESMVACYHDDIEFNDPAFGTLKGEDAKDMWRMLCMNGKNLKLEVSGVEQNNNTGKAHWEAHYLFSATGRNVHNIIDATFELKDGLIIKHHDHFNLKSWAGQALGIKGRLLGGTKFFKKKLHAQTNANLRKFQAAQQKKRS